MRPAIVLLGSLALHALAFAMLAGGSGPRIESVPATRAELAPELVEVAPSAAPPVPPGPECPSEGSSAAHAKTSARAPKTTSATSSSARRPAESSAPVAPPATPEPHPGALPFPLTAVAETGDWITGLGLSDGAGAALLDSLGGGGGARGSGRPPGLSETAWSCPWPEAAALAGVDHAIINMTVRVALDGRPSAPELVDDPGFGFGAAALRCSLEHVYRPGRSAKGTAVVGRTRPFQVHFDRSTVVAGSSSGVH
jgi:hypothetical protein